jgi:lipid-binding SYLF domain-containing protein
MKKIFSALLGMALLCPAFAYADPPQELVDNATLTVEHIMEGSEGNTAAQFLRRAVGVVICPNIFRGGFIFGGEGGGCVMIARNHNGGGWSYPALYGFGGGSFGFQAGVQSSKVMMFIMTRGGLNALLNSNFKFGADAGVSVATLGAGVNGSMSTALDADIVTLSQSEGLYGGISLAGSVMSDNASGDQAYYGQELDARQIVSEGQGSNPGANPLRSMLGRYGG